jgi:hypothetical protein
MSVFSAKLPFSSVLFKNRAFSSKVFERIVDVTDPRFKALMPLAPAQVKKTEFFSEKTSKF